jgi:O-antigen/teichoic acid export membrane protein
MGSNYIEEPTLAILAIGTLAQMTSGPISSVLMGMNAHGRIGIAQLAAAATVVPLGAALVVIFQLGLPGVAAATALPMVVVNFGYVTHRAAGLLSISPCKLLGAIYGRPLACVAPYALSLVSLRVAVPERPVLILIGAAIASLTVLLPVYLVCVLPLHSAWKWRGMRES